MRLAIADPPYLGRAARWYGAGRGKAGGEGKADFHPAATEWDKPGRHLQLLAELERDYDGWAIAMNTDMLRLYLPAAAPDIRVLTWVRGNAVPSGSRVAAQWEPVLAHIPVGRRAHGTGLEVSDTLSAGIDRPSRRGGGSWAASPRHSRDGSQPSSATTLPSTSSSISFPGPDQSAGRQTECSHE